MYNVFYVSQYERSLGRRINLSEQDLFTILQQHFLEAKDEFEELIEQTPNLSYIEFCSEFKKVWDELLVDAQEYRYVDYKVYEVNPNGRLILLELRDLVDLGFTEHVYEWIKKITL